MKNITKMRIIHTRGCNPEVEYIKEFFKYIGLIVHDEIVITPSDDAMYWAKHLKQTNDNDGVDIVLNYCSEEYYSYENNRFYLYVDLENKICKISSWPLTALQIYSLAREKSCASKRDTRIEILNLLINEIWKNDEKNRIEIQQIKEYYVPQNEDRDLFYILQAEHCFENVSTSHIIELENNQRKKMNSKRYPVIPTGLWLNSYTTTMYTELWRMHCLLKNDNPYADYAKINTDKLLLTLYEHTADRNKEYALNDIKYNEDRLELYSINSLIDMSFDFYKKYPWFTGIYFMLLELTWVTNGYGSLYNSVCDYLINASKQSNFPDYYSPLYCYIGTKELMYCENIDYEFIEHIKYHRKQVESYYLKAIELNPKNYEAIYRLGVINTEDGNFKAAESFFKNITYTSFGDHLWFSDNPRYDLVSIEEHFIYFQSTIMLAKIALNLDLALSLCGHVKKAIYTATTIDNASLIAKLADENEQAYNDFIHYHNYSEAVWILCKYLESWFRTADFRHDDIWIKNALTRKLSKWKSI